MSSETLPTTVTPDDEDVMSTVEDVIDAYCYDEEEREQELRESNRGMLDYSHDALGLENPDHSSTHSVEAGSRSSQYSPELPARAADQIAPLPKDNDAVRRSADTLGNRLSGPVNPGIKVSNMGDVSPLSATHFDDQQNGHISYLPPLQLSPLKVDYDPTQLSLEHPSVQPHDNAWQRSSEEIPRPGSMAARTSVVGPLTPAKRMSRPPLRPQLSRKHSGDCEKMQEIYRELKSLPRLPKKKSRMSRQDWDEIHAYSQRHSRGPSVSSRTTDDAKKAEVSSPPSPPKRSDPLPEVDEDEAFPRRASTSIFDRRSTLFELGKFQPSPPAKSKTTEFSNKAVITNKQRMGLRTVVTAVERDRYGFKKVTDKISLQEYDAWFAKYDEYVSRRRNKWIALMGKQGLPTINPSQFPEPCDKVKRYARKGYPPEWRGAMWWFYSGGQYKIRQADMAGLYPSLRTRVNQGELNRDDREAIERDLDRTFPDNIHFRPDSTPDNPDEKAAQEPSLITDLREVLSCFALNNPSIGYCQSLNFIAGLLLLFLKQDTERAFVLLTIITQHHLPGAHARSLANTEVNVLMMLIRDYLPKVWASINDTDLVNSGPGSHAHPDSKFQRQPTVALSCTSWFMSLFVGVLPIETVLRVWDAFLYEGPRALYRYALAIFKLGEGEIRKYRPGDGELFMAVQNLPRRCLDPNVLHDIAFVKKGFGSLTQNVIDQKRLFWREQNERAKRSASQKSKNGLLAVESDMAEPNEPHKRGLGGLKRKASKRLLRKKTAS